MSLALCCALIAPAPAFAVGQAATSSGEAASSATAAQPPCCVVPAGTLVVVELTEPLSSDTSKAGDGFGLRLLTPLVAQGRVVAPVGATGRGEVIDAKPAGHGGRPGRLVLAARYVESGPLRIRLRSLKPGGGGEDNSSTVVGATFIVGIAGALITGGGVDYPAGTQAMAKVAADVTFPPDAASGGAPPVPPHP